MSLIRPILRRPDTVDDVGKVASFNGTEIVWVTPSAGGGPLSAGSAGDIASLVYGGSAVAGSSGKYADAGHQHAIAAPTYTQVGAAAAAHTHSVGNVTGLDEQIRDVIGAALVSGTNIVITVSDAGDTLTFSAPDVVPITAVGVPFGVAPLDGAGKVPSAYLNTPSGLGTAATRNVPSSGDASSTEVVLGSDTRLSDARTPTAHGHTSGAITDFSEAVQDVVGSFIVPGTGIAVTYDDVNNQMVLTNIGGSGGGGGGGTTVYVTGLVENSSPAALTNRNIVQAALDSVKLTGGRVVVPQGYFRLQGGITIWQQVTLEGTGNTVLDFGPSTAGTTGVTVTTNNSFLGGGISTWCAMRSIRLSGANYPETMIYNATLNGLRIESPHAYFHAVTISGFGKAVTYGDHAYLSHFFGGRISYNEYGVYFDGSVQTDLGENLTMFGVVFGNNQHHIHNSLGGSLWFSHCSLDYPSGTYVSAHSAKQGGYNLARLEFNSCHFETNVSTSGSGPRFICNSHLRINGGMLWDNLQGPMFDLGSDAWLDLDGVQLVQDENAYLCTGSGFVTTRGVMPVAFHRNLRINRATSNLHNNGFELGNLDGWRASGNGATVSSSSPKDGSYSLRLAPSSGAVATTVVSDRVSVHGQSDIRCSYFWKNTDTTHAGTVELVILSSMGYELRKVSSSLAANASAWTNGRMSVEDLSTDAEWVEIRFTVNGAATGQVWIDEVVFTSLGIASGRRAATLAAPRDYCGTANPNGGQLAGEGSRYTRLTPGAPTFWFKASGGYSTSGWVEVGSGGGGGGGDGFDELQSVAYASSITPDAANGEVVMVGQLTGNITINNPANSIPGQFLEFHFQQDADGGAVVSWGANFETPAPINTTGNARSFVRFRCLTPTLWVEI